MHLTISPAYGRDYKSKKAAEEAWKAGKDFAIGSGGRPYVNIQQSEELKKDGYSKVGIRYAKLRKQTFVTL